MTPMFGYCLNAGSGSGWGNDVVWGISVVVYGFGKVVGTVGSSVVVVEEHNHL